MCIRHIDASAFDWMGRGNDEFGCVTFGITGANLFRVRSRDLVLGPNLWTALAYAVFGGAALCLVNMVI